jgi:hypothetical protein
LTPSIASTFDIGTPSLALLHITRDFTYSITIPHSSAFALDDLHLDRLRLGLQLTQASSLLNIRLRNPNQHTSNMSFNTTFPPSQPADAFVSHLHPPHRRNNTKY